MSRARDTADQINRVNSSAANATAITVDSSENVGIGTSSPNAPLDVVSSLSTTRAKVRNESTGGAAILFQNSDTGTGNGDGLYLGNSGGINYLWSYENEPIVFATNNLERMRILPSGGLTFNGDTAAANALDDYEEGTWTPSLGGNATYNFQSGFYTKVGRQVTLVFYLDVASIGTGSTSTITGQPFASTTFAPGSGAISRFTNTASSYVSASGQIGSSNIVIVGKTSASINTANLSPFQNGTAMYMTITYFTS